MDVQPNVQTDTVIKAFLRSELQLIRSQKKLLSVLPRDLASDYRYILENLLERLNRQEFDLVAVGRALLVDADWALKVREGREQDILPFSREALMSLD